MKFGELSEQIIGCAYRVYNTMGFGFLESVYEKCLIIELEMNDLIVESQRPLSVFYEGQVVGEFFADLIVEEKIIVELKSVRQLAKRMRCSWSTTWSQQRPMSAYSSTLARNPLK